MTSHRPDLPPAVLPTPAGAPAARYSVVRLGAIAGGYATPNGLNDNAVAVGSVTPPGGTDYAFYHAGAGIRRLDPLGRAPSVALGVNLARHVVGYLTARGGATHAFLHNGKMHDIGTLGGRNSKAMGINEEGTIVGESGVPGGATHAFLYRGGTMRGLGTLGGRDSCARQVNNFRQAAGYASLPGGATHAAVFIDDEVIDLGTLIGAEYNSFAYAINLRGEVAGSSMFEESAFTHAMVYTAAGMTDIGIGRSSEAFGINDLGQAVGHALLGPGQMGGFLYEAGMTRLLNDLIDPASGWSIQSAHAINNHGQIAAFGSRPGGAPEALRLDPVPPHAGA